MKLFAALLTTLFVVGSYSKPLEEDADYDQVSETLERASDQVNAVLEDLERVSAQLDADAAANDGEDVQMAKRDPDPHDPRLDFEKLKKGKTNIVNGNVEFAEEIVGSYIVIAKSRISTKGYLMLMRNIEAQAVKLYPDGVKNVFYRSKDPVVTVPMNGTAFGFWDMRDFAVKYEGDSTETIAAYHKNPAREGRKETGFRGFFIGANEPLATFASKQEGVLLVERNMMPTLDACAQPVEPVECNWGKSRLNYDGYRENASMGFDANARGYWTLAAHNSNCATAGLVYDSDATKVGPPVQAFIIDGGIAQHQAFGDRVRVAPERAQIEAMLDKEPPHYGVWHGNHVAGIITATLRGVARTVKVDSFNGYSTYFVGAEAMLNAYEAILSRFYKEDNGSNAVTKPRYVINQSMGFNEPIPGNEQGAKRPIAVQAVVLAMKKLSRPGIYISQSAGNDNKYVLADSCAGLGQVGRATVANDDHLMVVGAFDVNDQRGRFSNMGACIGINAPGVKIHSATSPPNDFGYKSGTSMAAPHVAGVMIRALVDNANHDNPSPKKLRAFLRDLAFNDVLPYAGRRALDYHAQDDAVDKHRLFYYCEERKGDTFPTLNAFAGV